MVRLVPIDRLRAPLSISSTLQPTQSKSVKLSLLLLTQSLKHASKCWPKVRAPNAIHGYDIFAGSPIGPLESRKDARSIKKAEGDFKSGRIPDNETDKEDHMNLAVCVEPNKHPEKKNDYKVWYLELDSRGKVVGINVKSREGLIKNVLENFHKTGKSNWRCFQKEREASTEIEVIDFIAMNSHENTHFGNLPTLSEFQTTLNSLQSGFELRSIA